MFASGGEEPRNQIGSNAKLDKLIAEHLPLYTRDGAGAARVATRAPAAFATASVTALELVDLQTESAPRPAPPPRDVASDVSQVGMPWRVALDLLASRLRLPMAEPRCDPVVGRWPVRSVT